MDFISDTNLISYIQYFAEFQPQKKLYHILSEELDVKDSISFGDLWDTSKKLAFLLKKNINQNSRLILILPAGKPFITSFFGCLAAGIIAVPLPIPHQRGGNKVQKISQEIDSQYVLTTKNIYKRIQKLFESSSNLKFLFWEDFIENDSDRYLETDLINFIPQYNPIAYLQFTSGSTNAPKGVIISHQNVIHNAWAIHKGFQRTSTDSSMTWLPHYHDMGLVEGIICPLVIGGEGYILEPAHFVQRPSRWLKTLSQYKIAYSGAPNFALELCVQRIENEELDILNLENLKGLFVGAEPIKLKTLEKFIKKFENVGFNSKKLLPAYGLAEATLAVTIHPFQESILSILFEEKEVVSCGKLIIDTDVKIMSLSSKNECSDGEKGEIWVSGKSVALGYWNKVKESQDTFENEYDGKKWMRTGDIGFLKNGNLYIIGRLKDIIILNGVNRHALEIEEMLENINESIKPNNIAAYSIHTPTGEKLGVAAEIKRDNLLNINYKEVIEDIIFCIGREIGTNPYQILLVKQGGIPRTSSGKIQRNQCPHIKQDMILFEYNFE
jgi:acyl-CoA synthetase (AMP-forming)/AMP-acid ligase II